MQFQTLTQQRPAGLVQRSHSNRGRLPLQVRADASGSARDVSANASATGLSALGHIPVYAPPKAAPPPKPEKHGGPDYSVVSRNIALELVRVTEAAALASARWVGKGDKHAADDAAVEAMRDVLRTISMDGVIIIGEGEKDQAPMLFRGEKLGDGSQPRVDVAVDPLDGTSLTAAGRNGAIAVIALAERGALFDPGPAFYMEKIAVGEEAAHVIDINASVRTNLTQVACALGKSVKDLVVTVLDRPRHEGLIAEIRKVGACIRLISDGDVAAAIATARPESKVDVLMGIGGTPEGVIAAAALKCMGGAIQGRLWPRDEADRAAFLAAGLDPRRVYTTDDLCSGSEVFFAATGVTDGDFLDGVRFTSRGATTNSMVMRSRSGTIREVVTYHRWDVDTPPPEVCEFNWEPEDDEK